MSRLGVAAVAIAFTALPRLAQADEVQSWLSGQVELEPAKRLKLQLEPRVSLRLDEPQLAGALVEVGLEYRLLKWLRVGFAYRTTYERDGDDELALRHRVHLQLRTRVKVSKLRFGYRLRVQEKIRPASNDQLRAKMRHKLSVQYRGWRRWRPSASVEQFVALGDFDTFERDTLRVTVGVQRKLTKQQAIACFYRAEMLHADEDDPVVHIIGLAWNTNL